jgi:hypothetical protein
MKDNRTDRIREDGSVARSVYVGSENPALVQQMPLIVLGLSATEPNVITTRVLPILVTRTLSFKWMVWKFEQESLTLNPHLGTNRSGERTEYKFETRAQRLGQHFEVEDEVYNSELGAREIDFGMRRFAKATDEYATWAAWLEITKPNPNMFVTSESDITTRFKYKDHLETLKNEFALPYKSDQGFLVGVHTYNQRMMDRCSKLPNTLIMPRDKTSLITNGTRLNEHSVGGDEGTRLLYSNGYVTSVAGLDVFEQPKFLLNPRMNNISPLDTEIVSGSFHIVNFKAGGDRLYSLNRDKGVDCLSFDDYVKKAEALGVNKKKLEKMRRNDDKQTFYFEGGEITEDNTDVLLVAPFEGYRMQSELYIAADGQAGLTTVSPPNITHGFDAGIQKHLFNMTINIGAHIFDYSVFIVRNNVYYNGYLGGGDVSYIEDKERQALKRDNFRRNDPDRKSMYVLLVPKGYEYPCNYINLQGRDAFSPANAPATYELWEYYVPLFGWDDVEFDVSNPNVGTLAPICYPRGYQRKSTRDSDFIYYPGETIHGAEEGTGCRLMRTKGQAKVQIHTRC